MRASLMLELGRSELEALQLPIVVESWRRVSRGRGRRAFHAAFSEDERRKARAVYRMGYDWYLVKGTPCRKLFRASTLAFIQRVVEFFATV